MDGEGEVDVAAKARFAPCNAASELLAVVAGAFAVRWDGLVAVEGLHFECRLLMKSVHPSAVYIIDWKVIPVEAIAW